MTPKAYRTRSVPRERHTTYLRRAQGFLRTAVSALDARDWDAAGLNAVHAAISAADALLVNFGGVRSTGESHHDVAGLLRLHVKDDKVGSKIQTLSKVLDYKNLAAYEDRGISEAEGREAEKLARRFLEWAVERLS